MSPDKPARNPQPQTLAGLGAGPVLIPDVPIQGYPGVQAVRQIPAPTGQATLAGTLPIRQILRNTAAAEAAAAADVVNQELPVRQLPMAGVRREPVPQPSVLWKPLTSFDFPFWNFKINYFKGGHTYGKGKKAPLGGHEPRAEAEGFGGIQKVRYPRGQG